MTILVFAISGRMLFWYLKLGGCRPCRRYDAAHAAHTAHAAHGMLPEQLRYPKSMIPPWFGTWELRFPKKLSTKSIVEGRARNHGASGSVTRSKMSSSDKMRRVQKIGQKRKPTREHAQLTNQTEAGLHHQTGENAHPQ